MQTTSVIDRSHANSSADQTRLADLFTGVRLTPAQRRIAAHIVQSGRQAAVTSSVELAEQVGVSQPSVTRLATSLGYAGFADLQKAMRAVILDEPAPGSANDDSTAGSSDQNKLQAAVEHTIDALRELRSSLADRTALDQAARTLANSPILPVYGARSAQPLAAQFAFFAAKIHPDVRLIEGSTSQVQDQLASAAHLGANAILCIALPRYPRESQAVIDTARTHRIKTVLLTDSPFTQLSEQADQTLSAPVSSDLVFDSPVAPLQLLSVLLEAMADAAPERTRRRLDDFERQAATGDYFLED